MYTLQHDLESNLFLAPGEGGAPAVESAAGAPAAAAPSLLTVPAGGLP
jgi:hypothetical protein